MQTQFLDEELKAYLGEHKKAFEQDLLEEAVTVKDKIEEILRIGDIDLINNAHRLIGYVIDGNKEEKLQLFAKQEGIAWATHALTLSFKLEWVQAIRRTLWKYVQQFNDIKGIYKLENFFILEMQFNNGIDNFLNSFFINYSTYKDELISAQREVVENLSVPIIPITPTMGILPLVGTVDSFRTGILEEKVLTEIGRHHFQMLIMDLSGIAEMETDVIDHLMKTILGAQMMGCQTVITGLRPEIVRQMINLGIRFDNETKTYGTLQQALKQYLIS